MFFPPRLGLKPLAELCHRLAISYESGIDIRKTWRREADSVRGKVKPLFENISTDVNRGVSVAEAMQSTGQLFPQLVREMVAVGEQSGGLDRVLHRLSHHYDHKQKLRRTFLGLIAWPLLQLTAAVAIIGLLIWILGMIPGKIDILGFGLIGTRGLMIYTGIVSICVLSIAAVVQLIRNGVLWTDQLQVFLMQIPFLRAPFEKLALGQLTWAMHLTLNVEMDLRKLIPLVLRTTGNAAYYRHADAMVKDIESGLTLTEVFQRTGEFPPQFLDALDVGEQSGQLVETMRRLSAQYEQEGESAMKAIAVVAGFAVWGCVAAVIIFMIFRIFGFYIGTINEALEF